MTYFVTGATGFIGRHLLENLLKRRGKIYALVRKGSLEKLEALIEKLGAGKGEIVPVIGDLTKPKLGVTPAQQKLLTGKVKHFFHLAAIYDVEADEETNHLVNVEGTKHALQFAEAIKSGCFHHVSSIAAAGRFPGVFKEDMFAEAEGLDHPYYRTKHESEGLVRTDAKIPYRIYRPAIVIGHSKTGEIDKIDGPYYFFRLIKRMREWLPA